MLLPPTCRFAWHLNSSFRNVPNICGDGIHVSQASASRYIRDVSLGLQAIYQQFVSMPIGLEG